VKRKLPGVSLFPRPPRKKPQTAVVSAIGDDTDVITVKTGDRVMYDKYAGTQVKIDGDDYLIVSFSDIIAVIK
jgi:chaperonin GroES